MIHLTALKQVFQPIRMFGAELVIGKQKIQRMKKIRKYVTLVKTIVQERKYNPFDIAQL